MDNPMNFRALFHENCGKLSKAQARKIDEKLKTGTPVPSELHNEVVPPMSYQQAAEDALTGYGQPDQERILLLIQLVLSVAQKNL